MILKKEKLSDLLAALASKAQVYVPTLADEQTRFALYEAGASVDLGFTKTVFSPKELLFPQTETLYSYSQLGEDVSIVPATCDTNQVIFGIRSC
ncbi:MAG: hypothetical protein FWD27_09370, partial [Coriobacteriia bacterium]|nr:hypothetical protein [Coriobacteriia bacterium]